jgi:hypothetical protein
MVMLVEFPCRIPPLETVSVLAPKERVPAPEGAKYKEFTVVEALRLVAPDAENL